MRSVTQSFAMRLSLFALLAMQMPSGSIAEETHRTTFDPNLDPIECYRSINQLDAFYRGELAEDCFVVPALLCRQHVDPIECISSETRKVTEFLEEAAALQEQLPFIGPLPSSYGRAVANVTAAQETEVSCNDQSEDVCDFINLMSPTMWAFRAGRIAGLQKGFYPEGRFFLEQSDEWDGRDPTACMIVNATLTLSYQLTITATCTERGLQACLNSNDNAACRQIHITKMREATLEAKQIVRSHLQMLESLDPNQEADLEILGELAQNGSVHCVAPLKEETCTYINEQTKLKLALNMVFSVEPSLLLELLK